MKGPLRGTRKNRHNVVSLHAPRLTFSSRRRSSLTLPSPTAGEGGIPLSELVRTDTTSFRSLLRSCHLAAVAAFLFPTPLPYRGEGGVRGRSGERNRQHGAT
jgi:hypothetical protein